MSASVMAPELCRFWRSIMPFLLRSFTDRLHPMPSGFIVPVHYGLENVYFGDPISSCQDDRPTEEENTQDNLRKAIKKRMFPKIILRV